MPDDFQYVRIAEQPIRVSPTESGVGCGGFLALVFCGAMLLMISEQLDTVIRLLSQLVQ